MTQPQDGEPVMTLPNGDTIRVGEYGVTSDGRMVGPMIEYAWPDKRDDVAFVEDHGTGRYWSISGVYRSGENRTVDIIAKWNPVEASPDPVKPAKRDLRTIGERELFGELDERTQKRLRKADKKGWPVQWFDGVAWETAKPSFHSYFSYRLDPTFTPPAKRVKSKPACATITQTMWRSENGCLYGFRPKNGVPVTITFTRTNGVIDNDSYKVEVKG